MAGPTGGASRQAPAPCSRFLQDIGCGGPWLACGLAALPPVANHSSTCLHGPRLQLPCSSFLGCRVWPNQKPDLSFDHSATSLAWLHPCRIRRPSGPWLHLDPCPVVLAAMLCPLTTTFPMPLMNFFVRGCISSPSTMPAGLSKMLRVMGPAASQSCSEHTQANKVILSTLHTPYSVHDTHLTKSQSGRPGPGCCTALVRKVCRIIRTLSIFNALGPFATLVDLFCHVSQEAKSTIDRAWPGTSGSRCWFSPRRCVPKRCGFAAGLTTRREHPGTSTIMCIERPALCRYLGALSR